MKEVSPSQIQTFIYPPPVGGLNFRDSLVAMDPADALTLTNLFPTYSGVELRGGLVQWGTLPTSETINTLVTYNAPISANSKLLAFAGTHLYDVTARNVVPTSLASGLSTDKWQSTHFTNAAGTFAYCVSGGDEPILYSTGGGVVRISNGGGVNQINSADPSWTSVNNLVHVVSHNARIWFVEKNTTRAWYLPINQIAGAVTLFDFGYSFTRGGYLVALATWSIDSGTGLNDKLVAFSSEGEAVVYSGTDPAFATTWQREGVFYVGSPVGRKFWEKVGGELAILTQFGLSPLSQALQSTEVNLQQIAYSSKIQLRISQLISNTSDLYGWQVILLPKYNMMIVNVPIEDGTFTNYVMNTTTNAWCQFTGMNSPTIVNFKNDVFFGQGNKIFSGFIGTLDNVLPDGTGGVAINGTAQSAFSYLDDSVKVKILTLINPIIFTSTTTLFAATAVADFDLSLSSVGLSSSAPVEGALWDVSKWDLTPWTPEATSIQEKLGVDTYGVAFSPVVLLSSKVPAKLASTILYYKRGRQELV